jgi:hypothetical protein
VKDGNLDEDPNVSWMRRVITSAYFRYAVWQLLEDDGETEGTLSFQTSRPLLEEESGTPMPDYKIWTLAACYLWLLTSILVAEGISAQFFAWGLISGRVSLDVFYLVGFLLVWAGFQNIPRYVRRAVFTLG